MTIEKQDPNQPVKADPVTKQMPKPLAHLEDKRAQNLRDNLLRRKTQQRSRKTVTEDQSLA